MIHVQDTRRAGIASRKLPLSGEFSLGAQPTSAASWKKKGLRSLGRETDSDFRESGSYFDRPTTSGGAARIQTGEYQRNEETRKSTDDGDIEDRFTHTRGGTYDADSYVETDSHDTSDERRRTITTGSYDEHGQAETRETSYSYKSLYTGWSLTDYWTENPLVDDYWYWIKSRQETIIHIPEQKRGQNDL